MLVRLCSIGHIGDSNGDGLSDLAYRSRGLDGHTYDDTVRTVEGPLDHDLELPDSIGPFGRDPDWFYALDDVTGDDLDDLLLLRDCYHGGPSSPGCVSLVLCAGPELERPQVDCPVLIQPVSQEERAATGGILAELDGDTQPEILLVGAGFVRVYPSTPGSVGSVEDWLVELDGPCIPGTDGLRAARFDEGPRDQLLLPIRGTGCAPAGLHADYRGVALFRDPLGTWDRP